MKACLTAIFLLGVCTMLEAEGPALDLPPKDAPPNSETGFLGAGAIYEIDPWAMRPDGKLDGITEKIPYIAEAGFKTLYIMPLFKHEVAIPYRVYDFYQLDPGFGSDDDLRKLVKTAHEQGLRVLLDLIVSHSPSDAWFSLESNPEDIEKAKAAGATRRLAQLEEKKRLMDAAIAAGETYELKLGVDVPFLGLAKETVYTMVRTKKPFFDAHREFFRYDRDGNPARCYPMPWGYAPDFGHEGFQEYMADVAAYWVKKFDIDGWRVDAPQNNWNPEIFPEEEDATALLRKVKAAIVNVKPEAVLMCERMSPSYGGTPAVDNLPHFDEMAEASYADHMTWLLLGFLTTPEKVEAPTAETLKKGLEGWPVWSGRGRLHMLETHDYERIAKVAPDYLYLLPVIPYTLPGIPMIFCGQEFGETSRALINWQKQDAKLLDLYKKLNALYERSPLLREGDFVPIDTGNPELCAYTRNLGHEHLLVVLNWSAKEATWEADLNPWREPGTGPLQITEPLANDAPVRPADYKLPVKLPPRSARVFWSKAIAL